MNKTLAAISLIILGILMLLKWSGLVVYETEAILGFVFTAFGLSSTNLSLKQNNKKILVPSSILFLIGIALLIRVYYNIPDTRGFALVSILFISGAVFLLLFIDNYSQKVFLITGIALLFLSVISITFLQIAGLFQLTNKIATRLKSFWPIILILFGTGLFINRKK